MGELLIGFQYDKDGQGMKALSIFLAILFIGQIASAQPYGYGGNSNTTNSTTGGYGSGPGPSPSPSPYNNSGSTGSGSGTGLSNYLPQSINNWLPGFSNPFRSGNSMPSFGGGYNSFYNNGGLFSQTNTSYYIYPAFQDPSGTQGQPETLVPNGDGTWYIYPATSGPLSDVVNRAQKVVPNNDGTWSIYPPGVQPGSNQSGDNQSEMQPERVAPAGGGSYNIFSPFGEQPQRLVPNGDGTWYIYPPGGGPA